MKYFTVIYKLHTEEVIGEREFRMYEMYCDGTLADACDEAEAEIECEIKHLKGSFWGKYVRGFRYEIVGLDGSAYVKEIEC